VESIGVGMAQGENVTMPFVRAILCQGQEKPYYEVNASIYTPDRTLRITRHHDRIAAFQSEYSQYREYVEDTGKEAGRIPKPIAYRS
jgi:hypothetical protein